MVNIQPATSPPCDRAQQARGVPVWAIRFAAAVLAGAGGVCAVTLAVFGSPLAHAAPVTALYLLLCGTVAVFMRGTYPHAAIGLCNLVTLARLALTVALVAPILGGGGAPHWAVFAVALLALGLDGLDGWFARRQNLASAFGARFDMEVDAGLSLILALNALVADSAGPLVLLLGLPRYVFTLAGLALPWLAQPLPERFGRKLACVLQIGALVALQAPVLPPLPAGLAVIVATMALGLSFGQDLRWLYQRRAL